MKIMSGIMLFVSAVIIMGATIIVDGLIYAEPSNTNNTTIIIGGQEGLTEGFITNKFREKPVWSTIAGFLTIWGVFSIAVGGVTAIEGVIESIVSD